MTKKQIAEFHAKQNARLGITDKPAPAAVFVCGHGVKGIGACAACRSMIGDYIRRDRSRDVIYTG